MNSRNDSGHDDSTINIGMAIIIIIIISIKQNNAERHPVGTMYWTSINVSQVDSHSDYAKTFFLQRWQCSLLSNYVDQLFLIRTISNV